MLTSTLCCGSSTICGSCGSFRPSEDEFEWQCSGAWPIRETRRVARDGQRSDWRGLNGHALWYVYIYTYRSVCCFGVTQTHVQCVGRRYGRRSQYHDAEGMRRRRPTADRPTRVRSQAQRTQTQWSDCPCSSSPYLLDTSARPSTPSGQHLERPSYSTARRFSANARSFSNRSDDK